MFSGNFNSGKKIQQNMRQPYQGCTSTSLTTSQPSQSPDKSQSPLMDKRSNIKMQDSRNANLVNEQARSESRSPKHYRRDSRSRSPLHRGKDRDGHQGREQDGNLDRKSGSSFRSRLHRSRSRDYNVKWDHNRNELSDEEREKNMERRNSGLPPIVQDKLSVCSTTLLVGYLSKLVDREELSDTFGKFGDIVSIDLIYRGGFAHICMKQRQDAYRALTELKNYTMRGRTITLAWTPGKGIKNEKWNAYWDVELGTCYIPWNLLNNSSIKELKLLEEGSMIDKDTLPLRLKEGIQLAESVANDMPPSNENQKCQEILNTNQPRSTSPMSPNPEIEMTPPRLSKSTDTHSKKKPTVMKKKNFIMKEGTICRKAPNSEDLHPVGIEKTLKELGGKLIAKKLENHATAYVKRGRIDYKSATGIDIEHAKLNASTVCIKQLMQNNFGIDGRGGACHQRKLLANYALSFLADIYNVAYKNN